jgi:hypothetical protein
MTVIGVGREGVGLVVGCPTVPRSCWRAGRRGWRAAVIAAVAVEGLLVLARGRRLSAGGGWERFELLERGEEVAGPGPGAVEVQLRAAR